MSVMMALDQRRECLRFLQEQEESVNQRLLLLKYERCAGGCGRYMCDAITQERAMLRGLLTTLRRRVNQWKHAVQKLQEEVAREEEEQRSAQTFAELPPVADLSTSPVPAWPQETWSDFEALQSMS